MPRPNMITGNYNYLGVGGHYKSGIAGLGNVSQGELDNAGLTISEWQHLIANLNDDAAYGPGGYYAPGMIPKVRPNMFGSGGFSGFGLGDMFGGYGTAVDIFQGKIAAETPTLTPNGVMYVPTPTGMNPTGFQDYMGYVQSVQGMQPNIPGTVGYYPGTGYTLTAWLKDNWMMLIAGAGVAMMVLPSRGRR